MKMAITIDLYIEGLPDDLQPLSHTYEDDVDAEGTMVAKYFEPLVDEAMRDWEQDRVWLGNVLILRPESIIAAHYRVGELGVDMVSAGAGD
jgi:chloramphenicol 3-O-phosphotransferase